MKSRILVSLQAILLLPCMLLSQAPTATPDGSYRLQAGDEIQVQVFDLPELNATVRIPPDGMISLLLLDEINASGRTVQELRQTITAGYARQYRNPRVSVSIRTYDSLRVYVTGQVGKPGAIQLVKGMTAVQAVVQAGGLSDNAKVDEAVILRKRQEDATPQVIRLHITQVLQNGQSDVTLQPGDVVYVPRSDYKVFVGGEVLRPGLVPMDTVLTAMAAVFHAGGFTENANPKDGILLRDNGKNQAQVIRVNFEEALEGSPDIVLQPFDIVYVPKSGIAKLNQAVEQYVRRVVPFSLSAGFSYLLGGGIIGF
jgi:polysaccharide export outer membrane protein